MSGVAPTSPCLGDSGGNFTKVSARANERAALQQTYASDPKYKKYTQQVDKCLNSFENIHEWADCIAFLKQLLKTFQSYIQFKEIPRKLIVAKRLAQCLNPALPTGVHQRALDVYSHILAVLGPDGLRADLSVWSSGLFPFFEYAATSVKPALLNLLDTHYLPLQSGLRPVMKSFLVALLPGLEEETSEFFDKVLNILDRLSGTVSPSFFFQNIWLIILTTPSARGTSLNYLARRLPHLAADDDMSDIVGRDMGLMIRAFASALDDENLLVRRGVLDILLQSLRLDSAAIRKAQLDDRTILMRAAAGVVLRRDLSLNRRLYTWLLGSEEKNDHQIEYLEKHALELLRSTLQNEMYSPSGEYPESRPFKIFLSLLDKWEVGAPLTRVLAYDAFNSIKILMEKAQEGNEDIFMTANMLYEALEPQIIWKQLLGPVFEETVDGNRPSEAIQMVSFILSSFPQEEDVKMTHLPIIFSAILDMVDVRLDSKAVSFSVIRDALLLLEEMLQHIPQSSLMELPVATRLPEHTWATQRPFLFACGFYGITPVYNPEQSGPSSVVPFASAFGTLASLCVTCADAPGEASTNVPNETLTLILLLMDRLAGRLSAPVDVPWDASAWLQVILQQLEQGTTNFLLVDRIVSLIVTLHHNSNLTPSISVDDYPTMNKMVSKLLRYLRPDFSAYHMRAVSLIWSLESLSRHPHVESILAQNMTSQSSCEAYEAFGVLWRLTEDNLVPGVRFKIPMMIVLDALKSDDPTLHRIGETWMRSNLKSYLRVLDPFLCELMNPSIRRTSSTVKVQGRELPLFTYERPFDQRYINYLLDLLLAIVRFGGQGFAKTAGSTAIRRSYHSNLVQRADSGGMLHSDASYLDVLTEIILRFIQSEPGSSLGSTMGPPNIITQSTAIDLLQVIITRGDVDIVMESIEAIVIGKLFISVHRHRLDLQNKLLHLLHSVLSLSTVDDSGRQTGTNLTGRHDASASSSTAGHDSDTGVRKYSPNPLLTQTLLDGLSVRSNRPVLQHWLDFILMAVPQFQPALQTTIGPLNDCLARQLDLSLNDIVALTSHHNLDHDLVSTTTDAEMIILLTGLERMIVLGLSSASESDSLEEETLTIEKSTSEPGGLLGYVSTVFTSDSTQQISDEQILVRPPAHRSLHEGIRVLFSVWTTLSQIMHSHQSVRDESLSLIYSRTRARSRRVLENLFRIRPVDVFESIVDCWHRYLPPSKNFLDPAFELVNVLIANAQTAVHMLCESISQRLPGASDKARKYTLNPQLSDVILFDFLEQYLRQLDGPDVTRVWGRFLQLAKEIIAMRESRTQIFLALRCITVQAQRMTHTNAMEDRRIRKEFQETFGKLLDSSITFVGRSYDQGSWIRRTTKDTVTPNGRDSPVLRDNKSDEKADIGVSPEMLKQPATSIELISQINEFVASCAIPNLRNFFLDNDKIVSICNNVVYYIVNPSVRGKARPMDADPVVLAIMREMAKIPVAVKAWKTPVTELLNDNRLFNCAADAAQQWKPIIRTLFESDKASFSELLAKVTTAPSTNIFTNREYEILLRSLSLRRLSFVLFSGEKNHFLTQFPMIQERLVDIFKNVTSPAVQSEVLLLVRVLLCRLSPHNMTSFWPVLLTELYRVFEQTMTSLPPDGSEDLQLVLAASKCLDLLLVLQTPEFQIHQWIFVTDTVDAIYRPDSWFPEAMMDQLADIVGALPVMGGASHGTSLPHLATFSDDKLGRRPLLGSLRHIESIRDLSSFFSSVSIASYESIYASRGNVNWEAVERGIMDDMFVA